MKRIIIYISLLSLSLPFYAQTDGEKKHLTGAQNGSWEDMFLLGLSYIESNDIDKAIYWLTKAEELSEYEGCEYGLGLCYEIGGSENKKDYNKAFSWMRKAAEKAHAEAQFMLAVYYLKGYGVKDDYDMFLYWLEKSAAQGNEKAIQTLAQTKVVREATKESFIGKKIYWYEEIAYNPEKDWFGSLLNELTGLGIVKYKIRYTAVIESFLGDNSLKAIISNTRIEDPKTASVNYLKYRSIAVRNIEKYIGQTRVKDFNECEMEDN